MSYAQYSENERYLKRVTSQHSVRPQYMAMLGAYLDMLQDAYLCAASLDAAFDLDTAVGAQLDILGAIVGANRRLDFEPTNASPLLSDEDYRTYIMAKITLNQWDGTLEGLQTLWESVAGSYDLTILDHQNMNITAEFSGMGSLFEMELLSHDLYAPNAQGVGVDYLFAARSELSGRFYIGGAIVSQRITEILKGVGD